MVRGKTDRITAWIKRVHPNVAVGPDTEFEYAEQGRQGVPVKYLLAEGRAPVTLLYWFVNFTNLLNLYFLAGVLPTILTDSGLDPSTARIVGTMLQVGGVIGTFGFAWLIARKGFTPMLTVGFAVASIAIALIGSPYAMTAVPVLILIVFITGWCIIGGQPGLNALAATYYPTDMRSTGIGWGLGWGRTGAIVGPQIWALLSDWDPQSLFLVFAVPAALSALAMLSMHFLLRPKGDEPAMGRAVGP
jgi:AAHS family 4-hydroxybenzoate transporter-like MFS transporter